MIGLNTHIGRMHNIQETRIQCSNCESTFTCRSSLSRHKKSCDTNKQAHIQLIQSLQEQNEKLQAKLQEYESEVNKRDHQVEEYKTKMDELKTALHTQELQSSFSLGKVTAMQQAFTEVVQTPKTMNVNNISNQRNNHASITNNTNSNNSNTNTNTIGNNNVFANLVPITNQIIKQCASQLNADPERPRLFETVGGFVNNMCNMGLNKGITVLDASRHKTGWIDGDNNNQPIKDTGTQALANKVANATDGQLVGIRNFVFDKIRQCLTSQRPEELKYYANVYDAIDKLSNEYINSHPEVINEIGRSISKNAQAFSATPTSTTGPNMLPQTPSEPAVADTPTIQPSVVQVVQAIEQAFQSQSSDDEQDDDDDCNEEDEQMTVA